MTRIIAGQHRGRRLVVPKGQNVRPTTDRMRERLFSILMHGKYPTLGGARIADVFAGTGALGLEALSRGAAHVTFVEKSRDSLDCLRANIAALQAQDQTNIVATQATALPASNQAYDFIFMDPPYRKGLLLPALESLQAQGWLTHETIVVCELANDETLELPSGVDVIDDRQQGQQRLIILAVASQTT